jgi:Ser-tRNA(Ala) deacylase AlaX
MFSFHRDARLRELTTEVLACDAADASWHVRTADTVFYPEGGGQPADHGTIDGTPVRHVFTAGDQPLHVTDRPIPLGPATLRIDWARRFDHMQQHTGQHLLSAVALERFGWATTAFHLGPERSDIELDVSGPAPAQLAELEEAVNTAIREARAVTPRVVDVSELDGVRTRGLPDGFAGPVRLVEIDGIDLNTCGGTHLANTSELGALALIATERARGGTRLFFLFGKRVRDTLHAQLAREAALNAALSCGPETHLAAIDKLARQSKAASKAHRALERELASLWALSLPDGDVIVAHRKGADMAFVQAAATALRGRRALLTGAGVFVAMAPAAHLAEIKDQLLQVLDGRGGGPPGVLQGRATMVERRDEAAKLLR